ncbi:hypothetical protein GP486_006684 [Trichoglossum hirsutum]|uniref:Uncharacterized protein n=1 Tax=Trichoglossum hirsutum TaxID=265104 RepID=A0A9P8IID7_9PEZI|nr:hypothetical protein GP486_006684 [Trichoglossum hirsutum]
MAGAAKSLESELSIRSCDAVNGGSPEEAAIPPGTEPTSSPRVYFVCSKRHTDPPPLFLNYPVSSITPARSPSSSAGKHTGFFRRWKGKIFRRGSRHCDAPLPPQSTTRPARSLAREVVRRASALNIFPSRQRGLVEPTPIPPVIAAPQPAGRARRHLSPLRSGTPDPIDVGSALAFGGRVRRRGSRSLRPRVDKATKVAEPPTGLSPEQLNRRRNRTTVVAGGRTFVRGKPAESLQWKWMDEEGEDRNGCGGCSPSHHPYSDSAESSAQARTDALIQLTRITSGDVPNKEIIQEVIHGVEDQPDFEGGESGDESIEEEILEFYQDDKDEQFAEQNSGDIIQTNITLSEDVILTANNITTEVSASSDELTLEIEKNSGKVTAEMSFVIPINTNRETIFSF